MIYGERRRVVVEEEGRIYSEIELNLTSLLFNFYDRIGSLQRQRLHPFRQGLQLNLSPTMGEIRQRGKSDTLSLTRPRLPQHRPLRRQRHRRNRLRPPISLHRQRDLQTAGVRIPKLPLRPEHVLRPVKETGRA